MFIRKKNLMVVVLLGGALNVLGQPNTTMQKEVSYQTSTVKTYSVPCDVVLSSLSAYDNSYLKAKQPLIRQAKQVIENGWLTITSAYPQHPYYDECYGFKIGKSVTDKWGTKLYAHNGEMYSNLENRVVNETFAVTAEEMAGYGVFNNLFPSMDVARTQLDAEGIPYQHIGHKLIAISEEEMEEVIRMETEIDFEQFYLEKRTFRNDILVFTERTEYMQKDGWIIPTMTQKSYNSELPSGIPYQITEVETYLSYKVTGINGEIIVSMEEETSTDLVMTIVLDENKTHALVHFSTPIHGMVIAKILNAANEVVLIQDLHVVGNSMILDISGLEAGSYTLICTHEDSEAQTNFIIEDREHYEPIDIQIIPNPVTSNKIDVVFSVEINTEMIVTITDIMGTVYFNANMFVDGNMLSMDIPFLTAGIYNINFVNNGNKANARFIKQ